MNSVIKTIDQATYNDLLNSGVISQGMLPKLQNCFDALDNHVIKVCIGQPSMLTDHSNDHTTLIL